MSRPCPLPRSGDRSKAVMVGIIGRLRIIAFGSCALHPEDERPARLPTSYLVFLGDRTSLVNPEFGSRQCAHNELDRDMRDNRVTGSKEPENEGQEILDRPVRCLQYRRLQWGGRRAAG